MTTMPEPDEGALSLADLAFMETQGSNGDKVRAAIQAYLWALENIRKRHDDSVFFAVYPSLNELREAMQQ